MQVCRRSKFRQTCKCRRQPCRRKTRTRNRSERKQNSSVLKLLKPLGDEAVKPGGLAASASPFFERPQDAQQIHLLAKIAFVELASQDALIQPLQFRQTELPRQQLEASGRVLKLVAQAFPGAGYDLGVIESQTREFVDLPPSGRGSVTSGPQRLAGSDQGKICNRYDAAARIATR